MQAATEWKQEPKPRSEFCLGSYLLDHTHTETLVCFSQTWGFPSPAPENPKPLNPKPFVGIGDCRILSLRFKIAQKPFTVRSLGQKGSE